jgi:hypothetical protein
MKKTILCGVLLAAFGTAHAQVAGANASNSSNTASTSTALGQNAQTITFTSPGTSDETLHTTPQVYVPTPANTFAQANCMVIPTAGASFLNFGFAGSVPIDGLHCDWRQNTGLALQAFANYRAFETTPDLDPTIKAKAAKLADKMLDVATDMQCLNSDRQRAVMEKMGLCKDVADLATLDHRFNQPRSTSIDYSKAE